MKRTLWVVLFTVLVLGSLALLWPIIRDNATFSRYNEDPAATMAKYEGCWDSEDIARASKNETSYSKGQRVGSITIPAMEIYEMPLYYGADDINNNWQITTGGYAGNWGMPGDAAPACVGAHNYQLFKTLPSLKAGDRFIIENDTDIYVYEVTKTAVYSHETDNWKTVALDAAAPHSALLITCYPIDAVETQDRYIVYTQLKSGTVFE